MRYVEDFVGKYMLVTTIYKLILVIFVHVITLDIYMVNFESIEEPNKIFVMIKLWLNLYCHG